MTSDGHVLSFHSGSKKRDPEFLRVTRVRTKEERSEVEVVNDLAGEVCLKSPRGKARRPNRSK